MPIPFLLAGIGIAAGVVGAGGHICAKETNEQAQRVSRDAQKIYDNAKESLENAQSKTEESLLNLGYLKKEVLETSIDRFLKSYDRIKDIQLSKSVGLEEISNFTIDQKSIIELKKMSDIYEANLVSGATGAATGALIALAASGSLPIVTGVLSTAGTALIAGEVGIAASLAGSALSFSIAMTPLSAIAAPVVLFTGISSSIKADENLEKAQAMYAEAKEAVEKMKVSETLCNGIIKRSDMFKDLLHKLNVMFSECTILLDYMTSNKMDQSISKKISASDFTKEEIDLIAVTRSLAGAVKKVIDTPILSKDGNLSNESQNMYNNMTKELPKFENAVKKVKK